MFDIPKYTQVANSLVDVWLPKLSGAEFKIMVYLFRRIVGFHKEGNKDWISVRQIEAGTGLSGRHVIDSIISLSEKKLISVVKKAGVTQCITILFRLLKGVQHTVEDSSTVGVEESRTPYYLKKQYKDTSSKDIRAPYPEPSKKEVEELARAGAEIKNFNVFKLLSMIKNKIGYPPPPAVVIPLCHSFLKNNGSIRKPWAWWVVAIRKESAKYFAELNIRLGQEGKKLSTSPAIRKLLNLDIA